MPQTTIPQEYLEMAKEAQSLEELKAMAQAEGVEATDEQLALLWRELSSEEAAEEFSDDELENVAGGCGLKEYDVEGRWAPSCPNAKDYKKTRATFVGKMCGGCGHFTPNTFGDWKGPGKCRR